MRYFWSLLDRKTQIDAHLPRRTNSPMDWMQAKPPKRHAGRLFYRHGSDHGLEDLESLGAPEFCLAGTLRMRHHPQHIPARTADSSDVIQRSVGIGLRRNLARRRAITKHNLLVALQLGESCLVAEIVAFHVSDGDGQDFAIVASVGERGFRVRHPYLDGFADIFQPHIPHQRPWQQAGLAQYLEAIANAEDQSAASREGPHRFHYRGEFGDGSRTQIVAISESAGHDDGIAVLQIVGFVPQERDRLFGHILNGPIRIMVTVGAWENDDAEFHGFLGSKVSLKVSHEKNAARIAEKHYTGGIQGSWKLFNTSHPKVEGE